MEDIFSDHTEEFVEILAHHFERGRIDDKAIEYLERAAVKCERLYANYAAADHWERLLGVLEQCDWDFEDIQPVRLKANLKLEELCRLLGRPKRAIVSRATQAGRSCQVPPGPSSRAL